MFFRAGKGVFCFVRGLYKDKKGNYPRFRKKTAQSVFYVRNGFRKKTAHNGFVTNLDKFCDRIFNGLEVNGGRNLTN